MRIRFLASALALVALVPAAGAVSAPMVVDPAIQSLVNQVSVDTLVSYETNLVTFNRRNTASDTTTVNGIGAARNWIASKMRANSALVGGHLDVGWFDFIATVCSTTRLNRNVVAKLPGTVFPDRIFMAGGHMDSRTVNICDLTSIQSGANDDGSAVVGMLEMARILSNHDFESTIAFQAFTGEEQSLIGSGAYANWARAHDLDIVAMVNCDIIGNVNGCPDSPSCGGGAPTDVDSTSVRAFAGEPATGLSRQLARLAKRVGEAYVPSMTVKLQPAIDRPGRGSDHISFYNAGFTSMRFIETLEYTGQQHNASDQIQFMEFPYMARNVKINLAVLTNLAQAPTSPSNVRVFDRGTGGSIRVDWDPVLGIADLAGYRVAYRFTTSGDTLGYTDVVDAGNTTTATINGLSNDVEIAVSVGAYDTAGHESLYTEEKLVTPGIAPHMPQQFTAWSKTDRVQLSWRTQELDLARIRIFRSTSPLGPFAQVDSVAGTASTYQDLSVSPATYYYYRIASLDTGGLLSPNTAVDEGRRVAHQAGIYLIDATRNGAGSPGDPNDTQVDQFYESLLTGYPILDRYDWQTQHDTNGDLLSDADLSRYKTVILHSDRQLGTISADTTELRQFVASGGQLWISGWELRRSLGAATFNPQHFKPASFFPSVLRADSLRTAPTTELDYAGASPLQAGYPAITVDPAKWPFANGNLQTQDVALTLINPFETTPIYAYNSSANPPGSNHGRIDGWKYPPVSPKVYVTDFPLYFMNATAARSLADIALHEFGYGSTAIDPVFGYQPGFTLTSRPNPAPGSSELWFHLPAKGSIALRIVDVTGRQVRKLASGTETVAGWSHLVWDGRDGGGHEVASGMYYAVLESGHDRARHAITILR